MKNDFMMREITFETNGVSVVRTRTSLGHAAIAIKMNGQTVLKFSNEAGNNEYEHQASVLADLLNDAVGDPCLLPKIIEIDATAKG